MNNNSERIQETIIIDGKKYDYIMTSSTEVLKNELEKLPDDARFISSSFMGYGLYKDFVHTKKELNFKQS